MVEEISEDGPARITAEANGIMVVRFVPGANVDAHIMRGIVDTQRRLGLKRVLVDARPVNKMSKEAQNLSATEGVPGTLAVAILIDGPISTVLGNFFLALQRPPYATKLFRHEARARAWLLQH